MSLLLFLGFTFRSFGSMTRDEIDNLMMSVNYLGVNDLKDRARSGDATAQYHLGKCYYCGADGITRDYEMAVEWFSKAAEKDNSSAQLYLAECYMRGRGVRTDIDEAFKWLHKAAENGVADAQYNLGVLYWQKKDYIKTVKWFQKAKERKHDMAAKALKKLNFVQVEIDGVLNFVSQSELVMANAFCSIEFSRNIDSFSGRVVLADADNNPRAGMSCYYSDFENKIPFRDFKNGRVYASVKTKGIYKIEFTYDFPNSITSEMEAVEYSDTLTVLRKKYGSVDSSCCDSEYDKSHEFIIGYLKVRFDWKKRVGNNSGRLRLSATRRDLEAVAEQECKERISDPIRNELKKHRGFTGDGLDRL